jgi:hypothetical protein
MVDFKNDLKNMMIADLSNSGITVDATLSIHDLFIGYWNILRRTIAIKPREVKVSVELLSKITGDPILNQSFQNFKHKAERGQNLNRHLSDRVKEFDNNGKENDHLLNEWAIYHFHLGSANHSRDPFFVERTGELLYSIIDQNFVYCIDIGNHENFSDVELLDIVDNNWLELLKYLPFEVTNPITNSQRDELRRGVKQKNGARSDGKNVNSLVTLSNGKTCQGQGGGFATSGRSIEAVRRANQEIRSLEIAETKIEEQSQDLKDRFRKVVENDVKDLDLKLVCHNNDLYIFEQNMQKGFKLDSFIENEILDLELISLQGCSLNLLHTIFIKNII